MATVAPTLTGRNSLNLNHVAGARIDQDARISGGRCFAACEGGGHEAIVMKPGRVPG